MLSCVPDGRPHVCGNAGATSDCQGARAPPPPADHLEVRPHRVEPPASHYAETSTCKTT